MKHYKYTELLLNIALITGFVICFAITQSFEWLFVSYFVVGAVQLLSMFVHIIKGWFSHNYLRLGYYFFFVSGCIALLWRHWVADITLPGSLNGIIICLHLLQRMENFKV